MTPTFRIKKYINSIVFLEFAQARLRVAIASKQADGEFLPAIAMHTCESRL